MPWPEIPEEYRLAYIRGIMEGDGSIGRQCRFVCGSFQFVSGFADWYRGRYGKDFYMKVENTGVNPKWRVVFNRRDAQFVHDIYAGATVYMRRKYDRYLKFWKDHCNASA
jgi:hypothetical protein